MSEAGETERRKLLGGFAAAFLMAAGYSQYDADKLGDLSKAGSERIRKLLAAKLEERKRVLEWAKKRHVRPFHRIVKPGRKIAHKGRA